MDEYNNSDEVNRLKTLNEIYYEENNKIKYEYRVLHDKYEVATKELEAKKLELENFKHEYDKLFGNSILKDGEIARYKKMWCVKIRSCMGRFLRKIRKKG